MERQGKYSSDCREKIEVRLNRDERLRGNLKGTPHKKGETGDVGGNSKRSKGGEEGDQNGKTLYNVVKESNNRNDETPSLTPLRNIGLPDLTQIKVKNEEFKRRIEEISIK